MGTSIVRSEHPVCPASTAMNSVAIKSDEISAEERLVGWLIVFVSLRVRIDLVKRCKLLALCSFIALLKFDVEFTAPRIRLSLGYGVRITRPALMDSRVF